MHNMEMMAKVLKLNDKQQEKIKKIIFRVNGKTVSEASTAPYIFKFTIKIDIGAEMWPMAYHFL